LTLPLTVRFRQPGDRFHPYGAPGQKKLNAFFIDKKVPRAERDRIPVVLSGGEIVWVVGYQIAEPFKVHPGTQRTVSLHWSQQSAR
jgi:tRNA(Ile)-lysidine synthase